MIRIEDGPTEIQKQVEQTVTNGLGYRNFRPYRFEDSLLSLHLHLGVMVDSVQRHDPQSRLALDVMENLLDDKLDIRRRITDGGSVLSEFASLDELNTVVNSKAQDRINRTLLLTA